MKKVLIIAQSISQSYLNIIVEALGENVSVEIISGSNVDGNIKVIPSPKHQPNSIKSRLKCWYAHFRFVKKWVVKNRKKTFDLIFATSNPPINSWIGLYLKKKYKCPFIYMNWDLYPQVIDYTIKNKAVHLVCKLWSVWNSKNYHRIDRMITIGNVMAESLNKDMRKKINVSVIPLAVDIKKLKPVKHEDNLFLQQNNLCNKFIVLYSGKMGKGHNMNIILETAKKLISYDDIHFVLIGNGEKYAKVKQYIESTPSLTNVSLFELQSEEIFPYSIACGDIGIVSEEASMAHLFMPSKTYSMIACGEAIIGICTNHDDLEEVITKNNIGYCVTDNNSDTLKQTILNLYNDRNRLLEMSLNSRKLAEDTYSKENVIKMYKKLFHEIDVHDN